MKSHASASSKPPVTAGPLTAAMIGTAEAARGGERREVAQRGHAEVAQVEPGAERRVGARDDDGAGVLAGLERVDGRLGKLGVHGVARRGPVEAEEGDVAVAFDDDEGFGGTCRSISRRPATGVGRATSPPVLTAVLPAQRENSQENVAESRSACGRTAAR